MEPEIVFKVRWRGLDAERVIDIELGFADRDLHWPRMAGGIITMVKEGHLNIKDLQLNDVIVLDTEGLVTVRREPLGITRG